MRRLVIAIDGPSGAGKGTVARRVAAALGYRHVDSGAMYRAVAWRALRATIPLDDEAAMAALAGAAQIGVTGDRITVDGVDVTGEIRTLEIDRAAAMVARLPSVRAVLVARQRELGAGGAVVMEGRDIGTVVFPLAGVKIYLDAAPEERARRRANDPAHSARSGTVGDVGSALAARDESDRTRATSPLAIAPDAVVVDTTNQSIEQVVSRVLDVIRSRTAAAAEG